METGMMNSSSTPSKSRPQYPLQEQLLQRRNSKENLDRIIPNRSAMNFIKELEWYMLLNWSRQSNKVVMLGLDAAGKTTILYKLHIGEVLSTVPTVGFNVEKVQYKNVIFTVWDIGGQEKLRPLWRNYFNNTDGLIYVVDYLDRERIDRAKAEFQKGAMTPMEVCEGLGLYDLKNRKWHIQGTCALKGDGLYEGLDWLSSTLKEHKAAGFSSVGPSSF